MVEDVARLLPPADARILEVGDGADTPASVKRLSEKLRLRGERRDVPLKWAVDEKGEGLSINPNDFLPADRDRWYHYTGSLTSGTFREDMSWFVMGPGVGVDPDHVKDLKEYAEQEARVVDAVDRRFVLRSGSA